MSFTNLLGLVGNQPLNTAEIASCGRITAEKGTKEEEGAFLRLVQDLLEENEQKGKDAAKLPEGLWQGLFTLFPQLQRDDILSDSQCEAGEELLSGMNVEVDSLTAAESLYLRLDEISAEELSSEEIVLAEAFQAMFTEKGQKSTVDGTLESIEKIQPSSIDGNENIQSLLEPSEEVEIISAINMEEALRVGLTTASELQSNIASQVLVAEPQEEEAGVKPEGEVESSIHQEGIGQAFYRPVGLKELKPGEQPAEEFEGSAQERFGNSGRKELFSGGKGEQARFSDLSVENEQKTPLLREVGIGQKTETSFNQIISAVSSPTVPAEEMLQKKEELMPERIPGEKVVSQILKGAQMMVKDGVSKLRLQLEPAELGKLELSIAIEQDLVTAKFVAESKGVQSLIESNLPQLRSSLQEAGLRVDLLQVGVQTGSNPQMQYHSSSSGYKFARDSSFVNGSEEILAVEETVFGDESWHGMVNVRV